ncbi:MAG: hypothetical protein H7177_16125 [Rhizobacter sp.]|nr:hypothetical protein [Bacteriovorax sp.]
MKNVKSLVLLLVLISCSIQTLLAAEASVALGKVAELSCHRLERLVTLQKIDEKFLTKLVSLQIIKLTPAKPADPSYKVIASQYAGADGSSIQVEMMMDATGKGVSQTLKAGTEAQNAPVWSDKDAASLVENSLHYILESNNPEARPFASGLTSVVLKQVKTEQGETVGRVEMHSTDTTKLFEVTLKEDGTVESANTINP